MRKCKCEKIVHESSSSDDWSVTVSGWCIIAFDGMRVPMFFTEKHKYITLENHSSKPLKCSECHNIIFNSADIMKMKILYRHGSNAKKILKVYFKKYLLGWNHGYKKYR